MRHPKGFRCLYAPLKANNFVSLTPKISLRRFNTTRCKNAAALQKPAIDLNAKFSPSAIEKGWYEYWKSRGLLEAGTVKRRPDLEQDPKAAIRMLLPPPNVTGELHIGHALMLSIQDSLARFYRMHGHPVIWRPGTDHAGIATQTVVERHLNLNSRYHLGRDGLLMEIENWREKYGGRILRQMERMGSSADPAKEYYTLSKELSEAVGRAFVKLHQEGLIYRSTRMVNWSVKAGTALSEIEVETKEVGPDSEVDGAKFGFLYRVGYMVVGELEREIVVSTTRPETIFGDRAIGVHPDDPRYADLHYKFVWHPLLQGVQLPVIPDADLVDPTFGTGAVKITPAHDTNDFEFWKRHSSLAPQDEESNSSHPNPRRKSDIPIVQVFGLDGKMLPSTHPDLVGIDRLHARSQVLDMLLKAGRYGGKDTHMMRLAHCSRTGCVIEPMLCPQWFLRAKPLADNVLSKGMVAVREGLIEGVEEESADILEDKLLIRPWWYRSEWQKWLEGMKDWCLSRQIWWGHRIPAWRVIDPKVHTKGDTDAYEFKELEAERWIVALTEEEARAQLGPDEQDFQLVQDEDVLDTWFSSGLLPLTTAGWTGTHQPNEAWKLNYPLSFIESGSDILFFWIARMAMLCTWFSGQLPYKEILLHPLVCDANGRKMSKSVGNVLDPLAIVEGRTAQKTKENAQAESLARMERIAAMKGRLHLEANTRTAPTEIDKISDRVRQTIRTNAKLLPRGIVESGADPLRMALLDYTRQTRQISFDVGAVDNFRKLIIKLYNLFKYFQTLRESSTLPTQTITSELIHEGFRERLQPHDLYMLYHLRQTIQLCNEAFQTRKLHVATDALRRFIYDVLGNVYVMFIKPELEAKDPEREEMALRLTAFALDCVVKLAHPIIPFSTEALWQTLDSKSRQDVDGESIMTQKYPTVDDIVEISKEELRDMETVLSITELIRSMSKLDQKKMEAEGMWFKIVVRGDEQDARVIKQYEAQIAKLAKMSKVLQVVERPMGQAIREIEEGKVIPGRSAFIEDKGNGWWLLFEREK